MISEVIASWDAYSLKKNTCQRIESVRAVNIQVDHGSQWSSDEDAEQDSPASIEIQGRPAADGFSAKSALICFYPDGDSRLTTPIYDEIKQQIRIAYPLSLFEKQVEILAGHHEIECTYLESYLRSDCRAFLQGNRPIPDELH